MSKIGPGYIPEIDLEKLKNDSLIEGGNKEITREESIENRGSFNIKNLKELLVGSGDSSFRINSEWLWAGAENVADAPFKVKLADGSTTTSDLTVTGGNINGVIKVLETTDDLQTAIDAVNTGGGGTVFLKNGTHTPGQNITLYDNVYLEGQSKGSTIIDFESGSYGIQAIGSSAYSTGTVSATKGSTTITGSGTTFTSGMVGQSILLSGNWYPITAFTDTTHVTISIPFSGATVSGASYVIATPKTDIKIKTLTVKGSATQAVKAQYAQEFWLDEVNIQTSVLGLDLDDCSNTEFRSVDMVANYAALNFKNVSKTLVISTGSVYTITGVGYTFDSCMDMMIVGNFIENSATDGLSFTSCKDMICVGIKTSGNGGQGCELVSGNETIYFSNCGFKNNTSDGIKLTASSDRCIITSCSLEDNGGYGINIAAATCDDNFIRNNNYDNNTSGEWTDSGTNTKTDDDLSNDFVPGTDILAEANTERAFSNPGGYAVVKDINIDNNNGTITTSFELKTQSAPNIVYGKIYVNGSPVGTEQSDTTGTYQTFTEDIDVSVGDNIQLYAYGPAASGYVKNFKILYKDLYATTVVTD